LYAAILRGRGGARRTTPAQHSRYGIWESTNGGVDWTLLKEARQEANGATDIELDPQNPSTLYASFWGDAIYKSVDAGKHWPAISASTTTSSRPTRRTRTSSSSAAHSVTTSPRRPAASSARPTAARPGSTSATTSTRTSTRWRSTRPTRAMSSSALTAASGSARIAAAAPVGPPTR